MNDTYYENACSKWPSKTPQQFRTVNPIIDGWNVTRKDENCAAMTRFLFECDSAPIDKQYEEFQKLAHLWKEVVFSGKKSLHCIMEFYDFEPIHKQHYKQVHKKILLWLQSKIDLTLDRSTCNPSRLTRTPNVHRETGEFQELIYNGGTISKMAVSPLAIEVYEEEIPTGAIIKLDKRNSWSDSRLPIFYRIGIQGMWPKGERNSSICKFAGYVKKHLGLSIMEYKDDLIKAYPDMKQEIISICERFK